jgi:hypothetical protein
MSKLHHYFRTCSDTVDPRRWALGLKYCMPCGDEVAKQRKFTVACNNKQGYELITNPDTLKQLNPKRTI